MTVIFQAVPCMTSWEIRIDVLPEGLTEGRLSMKFLAEQNRMKVAISRILSYFAASQPPHDLDPNHCPASRRPCLTLVSELR